MTKRLFSMFVILCAFALSAVAEPVTLKQAKDIAANYMKEGNAPKMAKRKAQVAEDEESTQPLYIFSRGENQGFIIVSGDDAMPPIIGYTEQGDFDEDDMPPALRDMLNYYTGWAQQLQADEEASARLKKSVIRKASGTKSIGPLMTSSHHQNWPYNNRCPYITDTTNRAVTGCVATAASQIIYYWRKDCNARTGYDSPTYGYGDAPVTESIPAGTPMKWDLMRDSYSGSEPAECTDAIATLVACVGASAWLTYGSSTGGYIWNCSPVFSGQFGLKGGTTVWKDGYTQSQWEKMVIQDLEAGRPILYSGYTEDDAGHAFVCDGYRVTDNLFHINLGWGASWNGYFTLDDGGGNGPGGYGKGQTMVWQIEPAKYNISAKLIFEQDQLTGRVPNTVKARITNNSTLPYKGLYLYGLTGTTTPSATSSSANDSDTKTEIPVGETVEFTFSFTPSTTNNYTLYLCDGNKRVLDQIDDLPTTTSVPDLTLNGLDIDDGGTTETVVVDGQTLTVKHVYNTKKASIAANFTNGTNGTVCIPAVKANIEKLSNGAFVSATTKTVRNVTYEVGETKDMSFDLSSLTDGEIYKFSLAGTAVTDQTYDINYATDDRVVYFKLMGKTLAMTKNGNEATLTGDFNSTVFASLATDKTVSRYDFTQVSHVKTPLTAANKNALFYVNAADGTAGRNIVVDGVAAELDLTPGYNFEPKENFYAQTATFHAPSTAGKYGTMLLPFDADTPTGMFARKVNKLSAGTQMEVDSCNLELKSGTPYIILTTEPIDVTANGVDVSVTVPSEGTDSLRGTWTNIVATSTQYVLDDEATQYFNTYTGNTIPALTAYMEYTQKVAATSSAYGRKDKKTLSLAQEIIAAQEAYDTYNAYGTDEANAALLAALVTAKDMLRTQPLIAEQTTMINALKAAAEALAGCYTPLTDEGFVDCTSNIQNASFEAGSLKNWTASSSVVNKITTSLANYMAGADGNYIAKLNSGGSISQTVTGLTNGTYRLKALVGADYNNHITVSAGELSTTVEATDFGPMYMDEVVIDNIPVTDGTLVIGATTEEDWVKVDGFRLYMTSDADAIEEIAADNRRTSVQQGVYDLSGRRIVNSKLQKGIYIIDGKKVVIR
ncbi:MAG: C10 family peptidase [Bacteroidaceae bacterium]|nr:C10 family peptidase [Bacteroidaceae bacterium]